MTVERAAAVFTRGVATTLVVELTVLKVEYVVAITGVVAAVVAAVMVAVLCAVVAVAKVVPESEMMAEVTAVTAALMATVMASVVAITIVGEEVMTVTVAETIGWRR